MQRYGIIFTSTYPFKRSWSLSIFFATRPWHSSARSAPSSTESLNFVKGETGIACETVHSRCKPTVRHAAFVTNEQVRNERGDDANMLCYSLSLRCCTPSSRYVRGGGTMKYVTPDQRARQQFSSQKAEPWGLFSLCSGRAAQRDPFPSPM